MNKGAEKGYPSRKLLHNPDLGLYYARYVVVGAKEESVDKRPLPERKSREAIIASLMADEFAELVTQAAVDKAWAIMRKQRQLTSTSIGTPPPPPPTPALPPPPPSTPVAKTRYHITARSRDGKRCSGCRS
jgi:hypothetical protein